MVAAAIAIPEVADDQLAPAEKAAGTESEAERTHSRQRRRVGQSVGVYDAAGARRYGINP
jgi:hypothetical protein